MLSILGKAKMTKIFCPRGASVLGYIANLNPWYNDICSLDVQVAMLWKCGEK